MRLLWRVCAAVVICSAAAGYATAQSVTVNTAAGKAIPFDPDKSLGSSLDILAAREFERVFSPATIQQSLSAGWGPFIRSGSSSISAPRSRSTL